LFIVSNNNRIWHLIDIFNYHSYRQVKKILKQEKPELVLSHNLKGLGYLTLLAVKRLKIRNIHTIHDVQLVNPSGLIIKGHEKQSLFYRLYSRVTRLLFLSPEVVISPSRWLLDFYSQYGLFEKSKEVVLPNPIIITDDEQQLSKKFTDKKTTYMVLGQLEEHKGILFLLNVFENFNKIGNCRLIVVGSGRLEKKLREKYAKEDWIEFLGFVPQKDLGRLVFKRVHYTIIPSLCYENSPATIYDSLKYATPVIASNIGGVQELVKEGVTGYTFEPDNKISLLNKLNISIQNMDNFQQLSENAKIKSRDYDIKNYIYKLLSLS